MNLQFEPIKRNEYSDTVMEDCIAAELGIYRSKEWFDAKLAENTVRKNFDSLVDFKYTEDGYQISGKGVREYSDPEYCIVCASFNKVTSTLGTFDAKDDVEKWGYINEALIHHFFNK